MKDYESLSAADIAAKVGSGETTAQTVVEASLAVIAQRNGRLNAFTDVVGERALARAATLDRRKANGETLGPLAGVPFSVKNLFDVEGVRTLAGAKINRDHPPAREDATLIHRLEAAGAILIGSVNMGEYAYDFTGENAHFGASRNPHDLDHMSGGSSGGSGTAVASGMTPVSLGSDTNGSIRVPSSLCGLFGLKPTYGRLSRHGTFPFVAGLDHLGPLARSAKDLALFYDAMQGHDDSDPAQAHRLIELTATSVDSDIDGLRIARAGGYFAQGAEPEAFAAVDVVAKALGAIRTTEIAEAAQARAAAFLITMAEGASLHVERLRTRMQDFDSDTRDRLIAGAMIPAAWVVRAQKFRSWYRRRMLSIFQDVDVLIAPATPCFAPRIGQKTMSIAGIDMPVRANMGLFTQPISFIGLPVAAAPVWLPAAKLPIAVQIIAAPWREDLVLRVARHLETTGVCRAPVAPFVA